MSVMSRRRRVARNKERQKFKKRFWVRQIFFDRKRKCEFHLLVKDLKLFDHKIFFHQFRMTPSKLEELLNWVAPVIIKSSIKREAIRFRNFIFTNKYFINVFTKN